MKLKKLRHVSIFSIFLIFANLFNSSNAVASDIILHQYSGADYFNEASLNPNYDIVSIETGFNSDDYDTIEFWIQFKTKVTASQFVYGSRHPAAAILIYRELPSSLGGGNDDIRIFTNTSSSYSGNSSISAIASGNDYAGDSRNSLSNCNPSTWTNLDVSVTWVGFSISKSCANIPDQFWVIGYADGDSSNSGSIRDWDYGPDSAWYVDASDINNYYDGSNYREPQNIYFYQSPDILLSRKYAYVTANSDSGLEVYFITSTPKICSPVDYSNQIKLFAVGTCILSAGQDGDDSYEAADLQRMSFKVLKSGSKVVPVPKSKTVPTPAATPTKKSPGTIGGKTKN